MLFNSFAFAGFLTVLFAVYWTVPTTYRRYILLLFNIVFYSLFGLKYLLILLVMTVLSYFGAFYLKDHPKTLPLLIAICLLPLLFYKYLAFAADLLNGTGIFSLPAYKLIAPIGISFYTFEMLSYLIDVKRGKCEPVSSLVDYAAFLTFFATISSGPIERASSLIPQLHKNEPFDETKAIYGLQLFVYGLFKKIVVADNLAAYVNKVFDNMGAYSGFALICAAVFFSIEIYCDFSGYSDMARGAASLLNIDITDNFLTPYFSTTVKEFWGKWHISLTSWFRDYIYIPLGGNRVAKIHHYLNIMIVFAVSGLWHGASLTYLVWGLINGFYQIAEMIFGIRSTDEKSLTWCLRVLGVFALSTIAWIFFRASSFKDVGWFAAHMFDGIAHPLSYITGGLKVFDHNIVSLIRDLLCWMVPMVVTDFLLTRDPELFTHLQKKNIAIRYAVYLVFVYLILFMHHRGSSNFIYFKF